MKVTVRVIVGDGEAHNFDPMPKEELAFAASNASQCTQLIDPVATKESEKSTVQCNGSSFPEGDR